MSNELSSNLRDGTMSQANKSIICPICRKMFHWQKLAEHLLITHRDNVISQGAKYPKVHCPCGMEDMALTHQETANGTAYWYLFEIIAQAVGADYNFDQSQGGLKIHVLSEPENINPYAFFHHIAMLICV
jgi:hypothetical protein